MNDMVMYIYLIHIHVYIVLYLAKMYMYLLIVQAGRPDIRLDSLGLAVIEHSKLGLQ